MGEFFENINIKGEDRSFIVSGIRKVLAREGFKEIDPVQLSDKPLDLSGDSPEVFRVLISQMENNWVTLYHSQIGISRFRVRFAKELMSPIIYFNLHDGDVLCYDYYVDGKLIDSFCSIQDYFSVKEHCKEGYPEKLSAILSNKDSINKLGSILHSEEPDEKHDGLGMLERFSNLIGVTQSMNSYYYLVNGERLDACDAFLHLAFIKQKKKILDSSLISFVLKVVLVMLAILVIVVWVMLAILVMGLFFKVM